jgi:hypothetical protein
MAARTRRHIIINIIITIIIITIGFRVLTRPGVGWQSSVLLSMGFGFVEYGSKDKAREALAVMNGVVLEGHALEVRATTSSVVDLLPGRQALAVEQERDRTDVPVQREALAGTQRRYLSCYTA